MSQGGSVYQFRATFLNFGLGYSRLGSGACYSVYRGNEGANFRQVASNLVEPGENALVLHTGYFADSFAEWCVLSLFVISTLGRDEHLFASLETYGAKVDQLKAPIGGVATEANVEEALKQKKYKVITITHVDTSTGVLSDVKSYAALAKKVSPETLVVLDGVCSVASEEIRMDDWGVDVILTASQKGLGTPPGLSILCASQKAIKARSPPTLGLPPLLTFSPGVRDSLCPAYVLLC